MATTNGWALEHRNLMAQNLGRPLEEWEHLHHANGNRSDNQIENLEIKDPISHSREHMLQTHKNWFYIKNGISCPHCGENITMEQITVLKGEHNGKWNDNCNY